MGGGCTLSCAKCGSWRLKILKNRKCYTIKMDDETAATCMHKVYDEWLGHGLISLTGIEEGLAKRPCKVSELEMMPRAQLICETEPSDQSVIHYFYACAMSILIKYFSLSPYPSKG